MMMTKTQWAQDVFSRMTKHADGLGQTAASFAFSMLGLLAAFLALFSVLGQSRSFRRYRESGMLIILLSGVTLTLMELAFTFVWSLQLFVEPTTTTKVARVIEALSASLGMVLITTAPMIGLQIRAAAER